MPAPAAAHTLHFPIFWAGPGGVRACLLLGKKNLPQHLKAANTFSREFKSTFLPRLKPAAFPKERTKPSGLRHARGAAEGGRCRAPTASGTGTAVRSWGQTVSPPGPEPRARNRRRTASPAPHGLTGPAAAGGAGQGPGAARGAGAAAAPPHPDPPGAELCRAGPLSGSSEGTATRYGRHRALFEGIWPRRPGPLRGARLWNGALLAGDPSPAGKRVGAP